jgi:ferredoxin
VTFERIWIDAGCIACNLCEDLAPEVFEVPAGENCNVRSGWSARLAADAALRERVREAACACPVEVIRLEVCRGSPVP